LLVAHGTQDFGASGVTSRVEPAGGFVGELKIAPEHGPVGTPVTVTGEGFPAGEDVDLVWGTVTGSWKVSEAEYFGRDYAPAAYRIATGRSSPVPTGEDLPVFHFAFEVTPGPTVAGSE
jgi:hypothetical protein